MSQPASLIVKLQISSAKLKELLKNPLAFAQAPSTPLMAPSSLTLTMVGPQTVYDSATEHSTSTFRKNEDLERENALLNDQLAKAQEQLAEAEELHKQEIARFITGCKETISGQGEHIARLNELVAQMMADTARQAREVAQKMMETAHKAQDMLSINNDDDEV